MIRKIRKEPFTYYVTLKSNILAHPFSLLVICTSTFLPQIIQPDQNTLSLRVSQYWEWLFQLAIAIGQQSCTTVFFISKCGLPYHFCSIFFNQFRDTSNFENPLPLSYFTVRRLQTPPISKKINTWCVDSPKLENLWTIY